MTLLPQQRMHFAIWRWFAAIVVAQAVVTVATLALLQHVRHQPPSGSEPPRRREAQIDPGGRKIRISGPDAASAPPPAATDALDRIKVAEEVIAAASGAVFVGLIMLPLAYRRFRRWTRGLGTLHAAIRRLGQGAIPKPVPVGGEDEVAYLLLAFNDMAGRLLGSQRALIEANADLERRVNLRTEELHAANSELNVKNAELAQVTETALRFTDDVAHEFRTPLTVVMEFASIIADGLGGQVTDKQAEYLQFIIGASGDLANLVDDFLDSSKLRARTLRVDRRPHSVAEIIDSAWPMLESRAVGKKVSLKRRIDADAPAVFADIDKARRALVNLVVNAIKFSKSQGCVTIDAHRLGSGGVQFSVIDEGPGMTPDEVSTLFDRFRQGQQGRHGQSKGFGLGLNIVRDLVAINFGTMDVKSTVGAGSTFSFALPPDDMQAVLEWYVRRTAERDVQTVVTALKASHGGEGRADVEELQRFLASTIHSNDLQLNCDDGRSIIVIGECIEPDHWRDRLVRESDERRTLEQGGPGPLVVEHVGTWPIGLARDRLKAAVSTNHHMEAACCA